MIKIFVYGTLREPDVQMKVIGRMIRGIKDSLLGYKKTTIENNVYPIIEECLDANEEISGLVLDVNEDELIKLDEYEIDFYRRKEVVLKSGITAWVYCK